MMLERTVESPAPDSVSRAEWRWVAIVAAILILVTSIPYIAGFLPKASGNVFIGAVFDEEDYFSHLAAMWQGYRGAWTFQLLATPEPHEGVHLIYLFYLGLGHISRLLGMTPQAIYHIGRAVFGYLALIVTYRFIALFLKPAQRKTAFLLVGTASGLGWLTQIIAPAQPPTLTPIDFWMIGAYYFFSILIFPHFSISIIMLLTGFIALLRHDSPTKSDVVLAFAAGLVLSLVHPFLLLLFDGVPALYFGLRAWQARRWPIREGLILFFIGLSQLPIVLYVFWILNTRSPFVAWQAQNLTLSPPIHYYVMGYGLLLLLAAIGLRYYFQHARHAAFIPIWIGVAAIASYLPWSMQRRFLTGFQVTIAILAACGLSQLTNRFGRTPLRAWWLKVSFVLFAAISNIYLIAGYTTVALLELPAYYHAPDEFAALTWLQTHTPWDQTVLAAYDTSARIFGQIGHRIVAGHWTETANVESKTREVAAFFDAATTADKRQATLARWCVRYVVVGPEERTLGDFDAASSPLLEEAFTNEDVTIYRVVNIKGCD